MVWPTIMISSPYCSPIILVSGDITFIPKFEGSHPERGRWMRVGLVRISDFRLSPKWCEIRQRLLLITNRKSYTRFRLVPKSTTLVGPEMNLNGNYALCCIYTCVSKPTTKICMTLTWHCHWYYQRQKCSPGILASTKVSFMGIFAGIRWRGASKWEWGVKKWRFSLLSLALSSEPSHLRQHLLYYAIWYHNRWPWMTLNALKSVSGSATNGLASPAFRQHFTLFEHLQSYPYTVSDKNVAHGT